MENFLVIKNGLVLTLDRKSLTGYFNIIIKNGKIFLIDYENKFNEKEFKSKNPDAEIIDAKDKLIMPGFFNSKLISSYTLNKFFLRKCTYENINSWLSLKLIDKYFSSIENAETLCDLLKISYTRSLRSGELFINESSPSIKKDFFDVYFNDIDWIKQYYNLTIYDYTILSELKGFENYLSLGFKTDEEINNYSLSSIKKNLSGNNLKLFIDASLSQKTFESVKKIFGKSFINVLAEMELISGGTVISNLTNFIPTEIEILKKKKPAILLLPSDYLNMSNKKIDLEDFIFSGLNLIVGTGYTGNDILSELKILPTLISSKSFSFESILRMAVTNPPIVFGISNVTGSIERNKSADLIFFEIDDIRNTITLPEIDSENVCEFIVKSLSSSDISDVILKGEVMVKDKKELFHYLGSAQTIAKEISDKIYITGKYFEFKEKYLMRRRVDKLGLNKSEEESGEVEKEEIFVDMTQTGEYTGEGEFTILGTKEEEFEKPRKREEKKETSQNLKEIKSLDDELNLFEGLADSQEFSKPRIIKKTIRQEKEVKQNIEDIKKEQIINKDESTKPEESAVENKNEKSPKSEFQKSKLKFGFTDEE